MKEFKVQIEGYYTKEQLPQKSGVYFVFAGELKNNLVYNARLLYVGESKNIYERHNGTKEKPAEHEHYKDFKASLYQGESLWYAYILCPNDDNRVWMQDGYIYTLNPPINKIGFNYTHQEGCSITIIENRNSINMPHNIQVNKDWNGEWEPSISW